MHKRFLFLITIICLATAACVTSAPLPDATAAMPAAEMLPSPSETAAEKTPRALTPEDIVYSFITAFADNPDEMVLYLSDSLKESLPEGGIAGLLAFNGTLEGLVFQSGSGSPGSERAEVEAHVQIGGQEVIRTFTLVKEKDTWLITAIEQTQN